MALMSSIGVPDITNEVELAQEFLGFWKNFVNTFSLEGFDMFITGESYGGFYVPYIVCWPKNLCCYSHS